MYDAVLEDQGPALPPMDPEMDKFLPMLRDYLTRTQLASFSLVEMLTVQSCSTRSHFVRCQLTRRHSRRLRLGCVLQETLFIVRVELVRRELWDAVGTLCRGSHSKTDI